VTAIVIAAIRKIVFRIKHLSVLLE
jgi:hypothetical protein